MILHDEKIYEKNLMVMGIKVVVGLLLCSEDIEIFYDFRLTRIRKFAFLHLLSSYLKSTLTYDNVDLIKNKINF